MAKYTDTSIEPLEVIMPKISVVMPVYNGEKYLREAIDSILNQTFTDFEFIIINDCSTDGTEEIIKSYDDSRIVCIKNEKNMGVADSLNKGLDMVTGEYIARMDADDISFPKRFEKQVKYMDRHKDIAVCGSAIEYLDTINDKKNPYTIMNKNEIKVNMLFGPYIPHPTVMMRRSIIDSEHYRYDNNYDKVEDFELWTRVLLKYDVCNIKPVLLKYRIHIGQVTRNYSDEKKQLLLKIKRNFLLNIGINTITSKELEAFNDYFIEQFDYNEQIQDLISVLNKIVKKNKEIHFFDTKYLLKYFSRMALTGINMQNSYRKEELIKRTEFLTLFYIKKYRLKQFIKQVMEKCKRKS